MFKLVTLTGKHLCESLFFNKIAGLSPTTLLKKRLWHKCFPVNFTKFLRTPFLQNISGRLLLKHVQMTFFFFFELFIFFTLTLMDICFLEYFSQSSKKYLDVNIKSKGNESWNKDKEIHIFTCLWYRWYWSQTCKSQQIYLKKGSFPVSTYFRETHRLMYKNSNSFVYIFVVICQFFSDELYHMSILFRNNRFLDSCTF